MKVVMQRAQYAKIERLVLNFVASEVLRPDYRRRERCRDTDNGNEHHRPRYCSREPTHVDLRELFVASAAAPLARATRGEAPSLPRPTERSTNDLRCQRLV